MDAPWNLDFTANFGIFPADNYSKREHGYRLANVWQLRSVQIPGVNMQFIKSFTIVASLALALSACSDSTPENVQMDVVGAITQSDALTNCNSFWGWVTNTDCNGDTDTQRERCEGLTAAPGYAVGAQGTWDDKKRACVDRWPSPICYGLLMKGCSETGTDATHQCSGWNVACRVMCAKWDGMRFGGYCSADWWEANP